MLFLRKLIAHRLTLSTIATASIPHPFALHVVTPQAGTIGPFSTLLPAHENRSEAPAALHAVIHAILTQNHISLTVTTLRHTCITTTNLLPPKTHFFGL